MSFCTRRCLLQRTGFIQAQTHGRKTPFSDTCNVMTLLHPARNLALIILNSTLNYSLFTKTEHGQQPLWRHKAWHQITVWQDDGWCTLNAQRNTCLVLGCYRIIATGAA